MLPTKRKQIKGSYAVCFSPDGRFLASTAKDVVLWKCPDVTRLWRSHPLSNPGYPAFSPDSSLLAVKNSYGHLLLLATSSGAVHSDFQSESDGEGCNCLFSADGSQLVDGSWKGSHIVRTLDGKVVFREEFYPDMIVRVLRHPSGRLWFRHQRRSHVPPDGTPKERLLGRDLPFAEKSYQQVTVPLDRYTDIAFSPDGSFVAILTHSPHVVSLFSFPAMELLRKAELPSEMRLGFRVRFSPCGGLLAVAGSNMLVMLTPSNLTIQRQLPVEHGGDVDYSPVDPLVAVGSASSGEVFSVKDVTSSGVVA